MDYEHVSKISIVFCSFLIICYCLLHITIRINESDRRLNELKFIYSSNNGVQIMDIKFLGNSHHNMVERKSVIDTIWGVKKRRKGSDFVRWVKLNKSVPRPALE